MPPTCFPLTFRAVSFRAVVYILFLAALLQMVLTVDVRHIGAPNFSETSLTEITQSVLLLLCTTSMLIIRQHFKVLRTLSLLLSAFFAMSLVRENDLWLDNYVFDGAWECLVTLIALPTLAVVIRGRRQFLEEFTQMANSLGFGLFAAGFLVTYVCSRLYGRSELWHALMGEHYLRIIKDAAEEITELTGYSLLLFASLELLLMARWLSRAKLVTTAG
ncbi:hypothetical protein BTW08_12020 [Salinicola sp. MH3R3-1]|uniref:hypothetical protein n=1 Tax=Salinicola sp. MH3R3-1 TaxID=1928762 RepID=UPI00094E39BC|nr:hypothetical protein [Salinicola sp. MH3R3-1]OLO07491.1 hypothetical protein BTW08_12020 [Salinicola sp. MH3R3-1]